MIAARVNEERRIVPVSQLRRTAVGLGWLACATGALLLVLAGQLAGTGLSGSDFLPVFAGLAVDVVVYASVGAILILRRPGNRVGLILMTAAILIVLTFLGFIFGAVLTAARGNEDVLAGIVALSGVLLIIPTVIFASPTLALVFPDGHLPGPRWRWPVGAIAAAFAVGTALVAVRPGPIGDSFANNPFGVTGVTWLEAISGLGEGLVFLALPAALLMALAGVTVRFRRARGVERQQLKWFVTANVMVVVFLMLSLGDGAKQPTVFSALGALGLSLPPIAVGIAILPYRLYDIDRIISRTLGWALVTGLLVALFAGLIVGLQTLFATFTGGNTLAVAASTLVVAALFQPVRRRVQTAVDRRFDRARYDAQRTAETFAEQLRNEVDLARLRVALLATAEDAVLPVSATVWLRAGSGAGR